MTKPDRTDSFSPTPDTATESQDSHDSLVKIMEAQSEVSPELAHKRRLLLNALKSDTNAQPQDDSQSGTSSDAPRTEDYDPAAEALAFQKHVKQGVQVGKKRGS